MKMKIFLTSIGVALIVGCAQNNLKLFELKTPCETTVEGNFYSEENWNKSKPALILREGYSEIIYYGEIISVNDTEIVFDPRKEGPLFDPEPTIYQVEEIIALVDSVGKVIIGNVPIKHTSTWLLELKLTPINSETNKIYTMSLNPNETFSFCIDPGNYLITDIFFADPLKNIDKAVGIPSFHFKVEPGKANYIGNIYLDTDNVEGELYKMPYVIHSRPSEAAAAGVMGGAIGGALLGASLAAQGIIGLHTISIFNDRDFSPHAPLEKSNQILKINKP